jgi:hypothetical protein
MPNYKCIIPRLNDNTFKQFAEPSLKKIGTQVFQIYDNDKNVHENIFKKYSAGLETVKQNGLNDTDIVILMHEDVFILDNLFKEKIELLFSEKPEVGLVGVVGANELTERGGWWMNGSDKLKGHIIQGQDDGGVDKGNHLVKGAIGYFDNVVCVDGCFMITKGEVIKNGLKFDDDIYTGNDFYDCDLCLTVLEMGYKIACADILIFHQSRGMGVFNDAWKTAKDQFINKWNNKSYTLPYTTNQFKVKEIKSEIIELAL